MSCSEIYSFSTSPCLTCGSALLPCQSPWLKSRWSSRTTSSPLSPPPPSVDVLAMGSKPGDALQDPPSLHLCQVSIFNLHLCKVQSSMVKFKFCFPPAFLCQPWPLWRSLWTGWQTNLLLLLLLFWTVVSMMEDNNEIVNLKMLWK